MKQYQTDRKGSMSFKIICKTGFYHLVGNIIGKIETKAETLFKMLLLPLKLHVTPLTFDLPSCSFYSGTPGSSKVLKNVLYSRI